MKRNLGGKKLSQTPYQRLEYFQPVSINTPTFLGSFPKPCPGSNNAELDGMCYWVSSQSKKRNDAPKRCQQESGSDTAHVAHIDSPQIQSTVAGVIANT